jgi:O-antigen/teichoic acid export membrane protein
MTATTSRAAPPLGALKAGLALTVLVTLVVLADLATIDTLTAHVRAAYPQWPADLVAADRNAIAGYLIATGVLGAAGWLVILRGVARSRRWARPVATALFAVAALLALTNLGMGGAAYTVVVPYLYGTLSLLPVVAGAVALVRMWRRP